MKLEAAKEDVQRVALLLATGQVGARLELTFDVEYEQSFESPGGYDKVQGVRYWDDVRYPDVEIESFSFRWTK